MPYHAKKFAKMKANSYPATNYKTFTRKLRIPFVNSISENSDSPF